MALKWIGSLAALAASAGLAVAETPTAGESAGPSSDGSNRFPRCSRRPAHRRRPWSCRLPPAAPCAAAAPCAWCAAAAPCRSCAGKLFQEAGGCGCDDGYQIRANVDYLLWFFRNDHVPVLLGSIPPSLARVNPLPPGSIVPVFGGNHDTLDYRRPVGRRASASKAGSIRGNTSVSTWTISSSNTANCSTPLQSNPERPADRRADLLRPDD